MKWSIFDRFYLQKWQICKVKSKFNLIYLENLFLWNFLQLRLQRNILQQENLHCTCFGGCVPSVYFGSDLKLLK